jgi:hypothetical protein
MIAFPLGDRIPDAGRDAAQRLRVSQLTTLFDGKTLNQDNSYIYDNKGDGTGAWSANKYSLSVTGTQYRIRQSKRYMPYFSGKSQLVEMTFDGFGLEADVTKRVGYFSSNATAPYASTFDGFWLENTGTTYILKASRAGTETVSVDWTAFDNYNKISGYDFDNFTVILFDFLWLGGAVLRLFLKTDEGFVLLHTFHHAGSATDLFTLSPNQPVRYEIRGNSAAGSLRAICSQVSTEGSIDESGYNGSINTGTTGISLASVGTTYPLLGIQKKTGDRDLDVKLTGINYFTASNNDSLMWTLQVAPTLSAPLTYADATNLRVQRAVGNGTITVSTPGRILAAGYTSVGSTVPAETFAEDYLSALRIDIDNTQVPLVLCGSPLTATVVSYGLMNFKEISG